MELGLRLSGRFVEGEQSGLLTRTAMTGGASLCVPMKKPTAFLELESAIRACGK
jgi:hypothetical protein